MLLIEHQGDVNPPAHETSNELDALARRAAAANGFAAAEVAMHDLAADAPASGGAPSRRQPPRVSKAFSFFNHIDRQERTKCKRA